MGITKQDLGNEYEMSINEFSHYSLFPGLFVAFTYNKKQPPAFGAALAFWSRKKRLNNRGNAGANQ